MVRVQSTVGRVREGHVRNAVLRACRAGARCAHWAEPQVCKEGEMMCLCIPKDSPSATQELIRNGLEVVPNARTRGGRASSASTLSFSSSIKMFATIGFSIRLHLWPRVECQHGEDTALVHVHDF